MIIAKAYQLILLCLLCIWQLTAHADEALWNNLVDNVEEATTLNKIGNSLSAFQLLRSDFTQARTMSFLKRPLITDGRLLYSKDYGLFWGLTKPYEAAYIVTNNGVYSYENGKKQKSAGGEQIFRQTAMMFAAIFTADIQALSKLFHIYFSGDEANWTIGLKPKKRMIQKLIAQVVIHGNQHVTAVNIHETSGDHIDISFKNMQHEPKTLTNEELNYFAN